MSMKIETSEDVVDSNGKNEGYLKIYYPKSSKFIKAPLDKNGKLLFLDIKKLDPSIVCLNLINSERTKFYDAVNGCFEEPPEKWSSFKVGAVLKVSTNDSNSHASISASIAKSDPDSKPPDAILRAVKQEPGLESNVDSNVLSPHITSAAIQIKQEACDLPMESYANQYQSPTVAPSGTEHVAVKQESSEAVVDSNGKNEGYLKIYYPKSTKFIKAPLDKNGKLLLLDIKKMDPSIVCLNLINSERTKFYDAVNGCFEEPPEKWSSFKVGAVLKVSTNDSNSHYSINASTVKSDPDDQQVIPSDAIFRTVKQEPCFESNVDSNVLSPSEARQIKQETRNSSMQSYVNQNQSHAVNSSGTQNVAGNVPPSLTTAPRQVKQEACDLPMESYDNQYQSPTVAFFGTENVAVKQETVSNHEPSDEPLQSSAVQLNGKKSFDFFTANFIVSNNEINRFNNMKNKLIHRITEAKLMLPFEDPLLFEKFFFLRKKKNYHPCLTDFFPERYYCKNCKKDLQDVNCILIHTFSNQHMRTALTQDELDKLIEAVSVIDYSDNGPFFTTKKVKVKKGKKSSAEAVNRPLFPDTLNVAANGEYEFFINQFYPKKDFVSLKRHFIHRIIEANLKLPFNDSLFIEKILFLRFNSNYRRFPKMKEVFWMKDSCENCNKDFSGNFLDCLGHLLKDEHIGLSLTQNELNKFFEVLGAIHYYPSDGFYVKPKKRKNNYQNSNKNAKHQRFG